MRDRVPSLDFWKTLSQLIENPKNAFVQIVQSEQKNFASFVLIASLLKIYILLTILTGIVYSFSFSLAKFFAHSSFTILGILVLGFLFKFLLKKKLGTIRIRDFYMGISYSLMPQFAGLFFLFALEFIVFGEQIFTFNPSPFLIKPKLRVRKSNGESKGSGFFPKTNKPFASF